MIAARNGKPEIVDFLIFSRADISLINIHGANALHLSIYS